MIAEIIYMGLFLSLVKSCLCYYSSWKILNALFPETVLVIFRYKSSCFGLPHLLWPSTGHDQCLSKVNVAADYSDSIPDSSDHMDEQGYHPLEELKGSDDIKPARLSPPEMAKTTVEVCA